MSYIDDYKKRLGTNGNIESDSICDATKSFIVNSFKNSPSYKSILIDGVEFDSRVVKTKSYKNAEILLLPDTIVRIGSLVQIEDQKFLITDFTKSSTVSKAKLTMCIDKIKWINKDSTLKEYYIIGSEVSRFQIESGFEDVGIDLATNYLYVHVQRNEDTDKIVPSQRFILGGKVYSIIGTDNLTNTDSNAYGITRLALTSTTSMGSDDFINGIADNELIFKENKEDNGNGGGLMW